MTLVPFQANLDVREVKKLNQHVLKLFHCPPCLFRLFIFVVQKSYRDFRLQGVLDGTLNNKSYETVYNRLTIEEATAAVSAADGLQGITMRDSDEEEG